MSVQRMPRRLRVTDATLLAHAVTLLVRSRIALRFLPWRRAMRLGAAPRAASVTHVSAGRLELAVRRARRLVPGATCLAAALALSRLLSRHGYAPMIRIGVTNEGGRFAAHAWIECDRVPLLSSAAELQRYTPLLSWPASVPDRLR
jgi:Transglutaminase-like superfamily